MRLRKTLRGAGGGGNSRLKRIADGRGVKVLNSIVLQVFELAGKRKKRWVTNSHLGTCNTPIFRPPGASILQTVPPSTTQIIGIHHPPPPQYHYFSPFQAFLVPFPALSAWGANSFPLIIKKRVRLLCGSGEFFFGVALPSLFYGCAREFFLDESSRGRKLSCDWLMEQSRILFHVWGLGFSSAMADG